MSSHHFVKEGQEPALFVTGSISYDSVGPLLEWAPLVAVTEDALQTALLWGIKVDLVLVASDTVARVQEELVGQGPVVLISCTPVQSQIQRGLAYLVDHNQKSVNIMSLGPESLFGQVAEFSRKIQINVISDRCKWSAISSGLFEKWLPAKSKLWLRKSFSAQSVCSDGLNEVYGAFESEENGTVSIQSDHLFWVGEEYGST